VHDLKILITKAKEVDIISTVTVSASEKIGHLNTNIMSTVTNYSENKDIHKIIIKTQEKFKKQE